MANPKVFEFAKEIGMTPLALMDKIREWQLPVKSHMSELAPEVMEQIRVRLSGGGRAVSETKPKRAPVRKAAKKAAPPPTESAGEKASSAKPPVIRRKAKDIEAELAAKAKSAKDEEEEFQEDSDDTQSAESSAVDATSAAEPAAEAAAGPEPIEALPEPATVEPQATPKTAAPIEPEVSREVPSDESVAPPVAAEARTEAPQSAAAIKTDAPAVGVGTPSPAAPAAPRASEPVRPAVSRKKEVVVGASGVSSQPSARKNIIGRMDLSRVSPPPGQGGYRQQGGGGGYQRPQTGGAGAGAGAGAGQRPSFGGPPRTGPNRNLRAGFVAPPTFVDESIPQHDRHRMELEKRKKLGAAAVVAPTAKEKEGVVEQFNAGEFRKREMVFQPRKKKGVLNRIALQTAITKPKASKRQLKVNNFMKVSDIAQEMGIKAGQLVSHLMKNGIMAKMNTDLDFDTIALVAPEFGWEAVNVARTAEEVVEETAFGNLTAELITRPPVVAVMGHVDHGKTSLLDAIRSAKVAAGEAGGITQHIGAYSVSLEDGYRITFLDTPGHEAFTAMRARGANVTDIAIIVVAADDGMMPQTAEAINHAKAAKVPIIIAINKIDKPGANVERIKQQLTELEIVPEEWGGNQIFVEVSALKNLGIDKLLESIKLVAEVGELKANPEKSGTGVVIEAKLEKGKGPVATLLVKDGTVKIGQYLVAGGVKGRVRSLMNDRGERIESVGPGYPAEVLGLVATPGAGDRFDVVKDESTAVEVSGLRREKVFTEAQAKQGKLGMEDIFAKIKGGDVKDFNMILKADVHGSLEAITGMIQKLPTQEVKAKIIHSAVGGISESDVLLAQTAKGIIVGFGVRPDSTAQSRAKQLGVDIRTYSIVYEMMDDLKKAMTGLLAPDVVEVVMGRAEVRNTFSVPKIGTVAGCHVSDGKIQRNNSVRLIREGKIVYEGKLASLKRFKDDAREVAAGFECGMGIENFNDIKVGDVIEAFVKEERARELKEAPAAP